MGQCVARAAHSCGTRQGVQVYSNEGEEGLTGFCWACNTYVHDPLGEGKTLSDIPKKQRFTKTKEEIESELADINECSSIDLPERKLRGKP